MSIVEVSESDEQLVQRMKERDEAALTELHRRYAPYLTAMARRMLKDPDEVQQSVQDAFVQAWNAAARFDFTKASFKTWLVAIAHRLIIQRLRRSKLKTMPLENWDASVRQPDHAERIYVRQAFATLESDERELIELAFYEGHSHTQLADVTGLPLGTVKTRLRGALKKLREGLADVSHDD
ncbi:MAG: sigma-70 family RNA polymerase sigma factor [Deinococcota bacterium]|jgi:RNA polymerase sigma-70 factor (ECF subfamily)|nr:sigma-70 family RNA polymerase sigma factor [Deinococcota bacterium]